MLAIDFSVRHLHWSSARERYHDLIAPSALGARGPQTPGVEHLGLLGPEATVVFRGDRAEAAYQGSLLYLASGLALWRNTAPPALVWLGESVWQTPDIAIRLEGQATVLAFEYLHRTEVRCTTSEALSAVDGFIGACEAAIATEAPEILHLVIPAWRPRA